MVLVGDEPYYGPLGFKRVPRGQISMPRPVDLDRILAVEIKPGAVAQPDRRSLPRRPRQDAERAAWPGLTVTGCAAFVSAPHLLL